MPKNILTPGCDGGSLHKKYVHLRKTFCSLNQQKGMTTPQSNLQSSMFLYVIVLFLYSFGSHLLQVNTLGDERTRRSYSRPGSLADVTVDARVATQTLQATARFAMLDLYQRPYRTRSNKISADPSRRQGERVRGAARKTGAEARTAKFEAGTWARKNARAWASKKRKNHEEGNCSRCGTRSCQLGSNGEAERQSTTNARRCAAAPILSGPRKILSSPWPRGGPCYEKGPFPGTRVAGASG